MDSIGWEIRPAGWILLILVAALLIYYAANWLERPSENNQ